MPLEKVGPMCLTVGGLRHRYPGRSCGLGPVDLELAAGSIVALVGPNGSGKSTLLRLMAGVLSAEAGRVELCGRSVWTLREGERAGLLALAPQRASLAFAFTVREYVGFGAYAAGRRGAGAAVAWALEQLDLDSHAGSPMPKLSVGQQQRATIARALAQLGMGDLSGKVLLADEPSSSLDIVHSGRLIGTLRELAGRGLGVVVAAHDLVWASAVADRGLALNERGEAVLLAGRDLSDPERLGAVFGAGFERFEGTDGGRVVALPRLGDGD